MCAGPDDQEITYCDPGDETKNKLIGWVDSDFGSDFDTVRYTEINDRLPLVTA